MTTSCASLLAALTISIYDAPTEPKAVIVEACTVGQVRCERLKVPRSALAREDELAAHIENWLQFMFCKR